ncbi:GNAT family N-acetyltransferase [Clostridium transplantifaecale]|uniref:GNAT family N-acetyltransferase n=1 Tax=Clostridium transplantifaecale TaxID=2479838 RepID=UPI000F641BF2|nr:GNAT family N-acetyltransferase [Clostridium transplantifaecale]
MTETERLILIMRPFNKDDLDIIMGLYSNDEIMRYMPGDVMDADKAQMHLDKVAGDWEETPQVNFEMAVIIKDNQEKIGRSRIHLDYETDTAMIGWLLLKKEWGKGYASEMTRALIDYSFDVLNVHRVCALCHPENIASWKALEKCGMRREAYYRQKCRYVKNDNIIWEDELEYAILKTERQIRH